MKQNIIKEKTFALAVKIVKLYKLLCNDKKEYVLSKQLVKSGTSIGANVQEAQAAQSKKDFAAKMAIASKEARETKYWLLLLLETDYLDRSDNSIEEIMSQVNDIINILAKIVKTCQDDP
ncbi:MAG: four helix bundle protein [Thermodesulfobacteriota bacterium]|nr:MAG: four helix bundle protein [Thermodesulfobacteriota bacterium]